MDNALRQSWIEDREMDRTDDNYYFVAGVRLEKNKKYSASDDISFPDDAYVELINGTFYELFSKANAPKTRHQKISMELSYRIRDYIGKNGGGCEIYPAPFDVWINKDDYTVVMPDISVICDPDKITDEGCVGAPDWIIEIVSSSNPENDYFRKLNLYLNAGVKEYWIVDPVKKQISVYNLSETGAVPTYYRFDDKIKAGIYDDLYIDFSDI